MDKKLLLPIVVSKLLTSILGVLLHRPYSELIMLFIYNCLFELSAFWLINKNFKSKWNYLDIINRIKRYLVRTAWFQLLMIIYLMLRSNNGLENGLLFFYGHVFIMFYTMGYILCVSDIELKERGEGK